MRKRAGCLVAMFASIALFVFGSVRCGLLPTLAVFSFMGVLICLFMLIEEKR